MEVLPHNLRYILKNYMKRFLHLMAWIALAMLTFASCAEKFESDPAKPEAYMKYFSLNEIDSEDWGYLDVSVKERISVQFSRSTRQKQTRISLRHALRSAALWLLPLSRK